MIKIKNKMFNYSKVVSLDFAHKRRMIQAASKFQDQVGEFITEAIKEKIQRDYGK